MGLEARIRQVFDLESHRSRIQDLVSQARKASTSFTATGLSHKLRPLSHLCLCLFSHMTLNHLSRPPTLHQTFNVTVSFLCQPARTGDLVNLHRDQERWFSRCAVCTAAAAAGEGAVLPLGPQGAAPALSILHQAPPSYWSTRSRDQMEASH